VTRLPDRLGNAARLAALHDVGLLDTPADPAFDRLTRLAADLLRAPVSLVTLVTDDRQFFKSAFGLAEPWATLRQTPLSHSFCQYVVADGAPLRIDDARADPRVRDNLAIEVFGVGAYLGVPLACSGSQVVGALCVVDGAARVWTDAELSRLQSLAELVMREMDRLTTTAALRRAATRSRDLMRAAPLAIFTLRVDGTVASWNTAAERLFGWTVQEVIGRAPPMVPPDATEEHQRLLARAMAGESLVGDVVRRERRDGTLIDLSMSTTAIRNAAGGVDGFVCIAEDLTERLSHEREERRRENLDAIARLAGGVAHDFNNLLTTILAHTEFALDDLPPDTPVRDELAGIQQSVLRGAGLVNRLLAFSGRQALAPERFELNRLVLELRPEMEAALGGAAELVLVLDRGAGAVEADCHYLGDALLALVTNAREAQPPGGSVTVQTLALDRRAGAAGPAEVPPGHYAVLSVSDAGCGLDTDSALHLFEPFYSTKGPWEGAGLGLPLVHGVVRRSGGYITVASTPGRGTTVTVYLPRLAPPH
jgi:PAS domain S-box-containing protein